MNARVPGDPDDLARAMLLRIVPTGYRVIDDGDGRFPGVSSHFIRLALRHVGPRPSIVGFCADGADAREAGLAAAGWAAANLRPTAVTRSVRPGVVVIAITDSDGPPNRGGMIEGAAVPTGVWVAGPSAVKTRGRPPGSPSPRLLRDVRRRLAWGEPPPTIGHVDVAERTMMAGSGRQRTFALSSGGVLGLVVLGYLALRFAGPLLGGPGHQPVGASPCPTGCVVIDPARMGASTTSTPVALGQDVTILFRGLSDCPRSLDPSVASLNSCVIADGDLQGAAGSYRGERSGEAQLDLATVAAGAKLFLVVR